MDTEQSLETIISYLDSIIDQLKNASRPSVLHKPHLSIDGDQFCVQLGETPLLVAGFGDTAAEAMLDFDREFNECNIKEIKAGIKEKPTEEIL